MMHRPSAPSLPIDIWLIIFDYIDAAHNALDDIDADSLTVLWCIVRNVSSHLRGCIDEYFRHGVLQNMLIDLSYSNMNHHGGPAFAHLHVPMRFSHLLPHGTRAVFRQMAYSSHGFERMHTGSVRGWVPFAERYAAETHQPKPQLVHRAKARNVSQPPAWEKEHLNLRNTLAGDSKTNYLTSLRDHTSIARGYRPPHYLKIREAVNDTELVDLAIDVEAREISFDWRRTFSLFFVEQRFIMLAESNLAKQRTYDPDLVAAASRAQASMHMHDYWNSNSRRARRKRLQTWVNDNKGRMTPEDRLKAEDRVERTKNQVRRILRRDNLCELALGDFTRELEEKVPDKCAEDLPYLLQWPWVQDDTYVTPRRPIQLQCGPKGCLIM
ncbi:hypothetical protein OPT61_g5587 [Boeremia exigua]|uniref:Uncharacterized protein n=1 Tax=Boeremia exigua TaxID=749465 RepID=A0ACC2I9W4_9PLEO|nr:hypothetical protein OPT61_g5587 [Boeremia exigua]